MYELDILSCIILSVCFYFCLELTLKSSFFKTLNEYPFFIVHTINLFNVNSLVVFKMVYLLFISLLIIYCC